MSVNASVLVRRSLRWPPAPAAGELCDVLYLKAGQYFADLRVVRGSHPPLIDWSMAGTCLTLSSSTNEAAALRFINEIDSRALATTYPAPLLASNSYINPDIASQDLATGDQYDVRMARSSMPSTFVETGSMPNPASSDPERNEEFEEIWHSLELPRGSPVIFLESVDGGPGKGKAFLASVGRWQLGLMDDGEGKYFAWRDEVEDGTWRNIYSIGDDPKSVVVPLLELPQRWQAGQTVEHGGREWIVREIGLSEAEKGEPRWD